MSSPPSSAQLSRRTTPRPPACNGAGLHELPAGQSHKLHSTNPIGRLSGEIKRRTEVVGTFPNEDSIIRLVGAILLEQKQAVQRARYMTLETIALIGDDTAVSLPAFAS